VRRTSPLALLTAFGLVACGGDGRAAGEGATVTDSAGVRVVVFPPLEDWTADVTLTEVLRVGAGEGPPHELFSSIAGGRILDDGTLVLADRASGEVRRFAPDGTFLGSHGREGEGPGEYEYIRGVGACTASGFTVFDIGWQMSIYDEAGEFVTERPMRLEGGATPYNLACDRSGRTAVVNWDLASRPEIGFHVARARLRILDAEGAELADLGDRIGSERFGRPTGSGPHPAGRSTRFDFLDSDLIVADGSSFGYERWNGEGRLVELVRIEVAPPDLDSLMAHYLEYALERAPTEEDRRRFRQEIEEMQGPEQASYLGDLRVFGDRILVREPNIGDSGRWFGFATDGTPIGFLPLPEGARLLDLRGNSILVEERSELDVPSAVLYSADWG
jgi:hypothetical protein